MALTIILALFAPLGLAVVFGITYKMRGFKAALITTGIALVIFSLLYVATIIAITSAMG